MANPSRPVRTPPKNGNIDLQAARALLIGNHLIDLPSQLAPFATPLTTPNNTSTLNRRRSANRPPVLDSTKIVHDWERETIVHQVDGVCVLQSKEPFAPKQIIVSADPVRVRNCNFKTRSSGFIREPNPQSLPNRSKVEKVDNDRNNKINEVNNKDENNNHEETGATDNQHETTETHQQLQTNDDVIAVGAGKWTVSQVSEFVKDVTGSNELAQKFHEEEIDGYALVRLKLEHLHSNLGVRFGPAIKLCDHIRQLNKN